MCAAAGVNADVTTNLWNGSAGGEGSATNDVGEYVNWVGGVLPAGTNVARFQLDDQQTITASEVTYTGGLVFEPAALEQGEEAPESYQWWLNWQDNKDIYWTSTTPLGYFPLCVSGGTLVIGSNCALYPNDYGLVRKEGDGTVRVSSFYPAGRPRSTLEVAEGQVIPMTDSALAFTDVRVTGAGTLTLTNYTSQVVMGSLQSETGAAIPLAGNDLQLGATRSDVLTDAVSGTGRVTAVVKNLYVTNIAANITYAARAGRLRLDAKTPAAVPFVKYDFEESLTRDSSGHGRDLVPGGAVTRIYDETRGGYVARFTGTVNSGGELVATVTDTTELTGDSDYTISLWAKTFDTPVENGYPTMAAIGSQLVDHSVVQFRFVNSSCSTLLLGHWNGAGDWSNLPGPSDPAQWHHYMAMREGCRITVWVDGVKVLDARSVTLEMTLPEIVQITLGHLPTMDRYFCGDIDDVRIYSRALGPTGVAQLLAGKEPVSDGDLAGAAGAPVAIPANARLRTELNGEIQLAGTQTVARVAGNAARGGIVMSAGGELAMTGPGAYNAGVRGANVFAKTGPGALVLGGALAHTGGTEVRAGTLILQSEATLPQPFAVYDFEEDDLGVDATCGGHTLTTQSGVTREYDAGRGGWVARFPGTSTQKLEATITSPHFEGNTDYTLSVWVKPDADCGATGTFVSLGKESPFQEVVFRYINISAGTLCLTHRGTTLDFAAIPSPANPQGAWHHYVAVREGSTYTVYCDGAQTWTTNKLGPLSIPLAKQVCIGRQLNKTDRQFKGLIDDVRIYTEAVDAAGVQRLYAGKDPVALARGTVPDAGADAPAPVLHYAFEDASSVGKDTAGTNDLSKIGTGTLALIDSPLGGKALKFDAYTSVFLRSEGFPEAIPSNGQPFTVSFWLQTHQADENTKQGISTHYPTFVSWGCPTNATIGYMLSYWYDVNDRTWSARCYVRRQGGANSIDLSSGITVPGLRDCDASQRWHHFATTYHPSVGVRNFVDGQYVDGFSANGAFTSDSTRDGGYFYLGSKSTATWARMRALRACCPWAAR
jgi:autotransporter-associated beta strand protein